MEDKKAAITWCFMLAFSNTGMAMLGPGDSNVALAGYVVAMVFFAAIFIIKGLSPDETNKTPQP